jgi:hypothetical protein
MPEPKTSSYSSGSKTQVIHIHITWPMYSKHGAYTLSKDVSACKQPAFRKPQFQFELISIITSSTAFLLQLPREHNKQAKAPLNSPRRIDSRNTRSLKRVGNNLEPAHWTIRSNVEIELRGKEGRSMSTAAFEDESRRLACRLYGISICRRRIGGLLYLCFFLGLIRLTCCSSSFYISWLLPVTLRYLPVLSL